MTLPKEDDNNDMHIFSSGHGCSKLRHAPPDMHIFRQSDVHDSTDAHSPRAPAEALHFSERCSPC